LDGERPPPKSKSNTSGRGETGEREEKRKKRALSGQGQEKRVPAGEEGDRKEEEATVAH